MEVAVGRNECKARRYVGGGGGACDGGNEFVPVDIGLIDRPGNA
jgi:hypothetical protein